MLDPAVDVLSHVGDEAINPQNKDQPPKLTTGDLEPGDKGKGWEVCECCPCPEIPDDGGGPGGGPPGPPAEPKEPEEIIIIQPPRITGLTTPPIITTPPILSLIHI